jgi:hypothetical protein
MRPLLLLSLPLLAACQQDAGQQEAGQQAERVAERPLQVVTYAGEGRDRLCLNESAGRIGFITYGEGDVNCSVRAALTRSGDQISIAPDGDQSCRIGATLGDGRLTLGELGQSCAYYCGPDASFAGKSFRQLPEAVPVTDLAGDPLC